MSKQNRNPANQASNDEFDRLGALSLGEKKFQNLYDIIIKTDPDKVAALWIDDKGNECSRTFRQFDSDICAAAGFFSKHIGEANEGRFVALMMENHYYWSVAFWGMLMAGYKPMLLDANHAEPMVRHLLAESGAAALVSQVDLNIPVTLIAPGELADTQADATFTPRFANELALCTSGTISTSKVYVFDEVSIINQSVGCLPKIMECPRLSSDVKDPIRHLAFLPMHHVLGFMVHCILFPLIGKTVVYLKDRAPLTIQETCKRFRITNMIVVPLLLNNLVNGLWKKVRQEGFGKLVMLKFLFALSNGIQRLLPRRGPDIAAKLVNSIQQRLLGDSIRTVLVGGSHIPLKTLKTVNALGYYPIPGFGMTESGLTSFETRPQARYRMTGCTGTPIGSISYKTVDTDDRPIDVGELLISGSSLHTARLVGGERLPPNYGEDGWFKSGDICRLEKGCLYIEGRLKEVIINESGENVYPDELEDVFDGIADVERLCILSLENETPYEDIALVFQLPENSIDPGAVAAVAAEVSAINKNLPILKRVRRLFVAAQPLPLANGIKVRRQKLKELMEAGKFDARAVNLHSGAIGQAVVEVPAEGLVALSPAEMEAMKVIRDEVVKCIATVLTIEPDAVGHDRRFLEDLGGDSLDSLSLLVLVETSFGVMIDEREYRACSSANDLTRLIWRKRMGLHEAPSARTRTKATPITSFTESREYSEFMKRLAEMSQIPDPYFIPHDSTLTDVSIVNGREVLNFASYNYICMSGRPETVRAACEAAMRYGTSASGSRLLAGEKGLYCDLENEIAEWKHTEAALVLVGGHSTNVTFVGNFCGERDLIIYDAFSHNSVQQGCSLSHATSRAFPHNNVDALEAILKMSRSSFEKVLLIVEGVYSMDGDIAPIDEFVRLKKEYGLFLMVDEAHSACVIGKNGGGVDEYFNLDPTDIDIKMGTLSKGLGACGGYLAGSAALIQYLRYNIPGFVFSVGISPPVAAAALAALRLLRADSSPVTALARNISYFVDAARAADLNICLAGETAIIPILVGDETDAFRLSAELLERGISVPPAVYPAVPVGKARLRFCVTSSHKPEQIDYAIAQLLESAQEAGIELPKSTQA